MDPSLLLQWTFLTSVFQGEQSVSGSGELNFYQKLLGSRLR